MPRRRTRAPLRPQRRRREAVPPVPSPESSTPRPTTSRRSPTPRLSRGAASVGATELGKSNLAAGGRARRRPPGRSNWTAPTSPTETAYRKAALWSKILPVMLLLWAMTGAFYPAVDLCAGEKERGTLETLLSSPAERSEIVLGKLLTIMLFSMATAVLNLVSMGVTGWLILGQIAGIRAAAAAGRRSGCRWRWCRFRPCSAPCAWPWPPSPAAPRKAILPVPLLLVTMPLAVLPMAPGVELNLGNSLIPVTGVVLLLRRRARRNYWQALQYSAGGAGRDPGRLPAGGPLGGRPVQLRVGPVPRERAAGRGPVAAAPAARPAADAHRGRGRLLRRAHPDAPFLHEAAAADQAIDDFRRHSSA